MAKPAPERPFALGDWTVDPARGALVKNGKEVRLEPQAMALLLLFAASPNQVIRKDEIIAAVWQGRAIGDDTLASAVSKLRTALGESKAKRYIETLPKRGYRLVIAPDDKEPKVAAPDSEDAKLIARGLAMLKTPLPQNLNQARVYFEAALKANPKSAAAHCGLAETMLTQHLMGQGRELVAAAKASALVATTLDETFAQAWSILGYATLLCDRDFAAADVALRKAIALNPMLVSAYRGRAYGFAAVGRFVEAERAARAAAEIEPLSLAARNDLLQILIIARRYAQAVAEAKRILAFNRDASEAWAAKGWAHYFLGDEKEAVDALLESLKLLGLDAATLSKLRTAYAEDGFESLCATGADLLENQRVMFVTRPTDIAYLRTAAGQADAAFDALTKAADRDDPFLLALPYLPFLDRLRNDPRFVALAARVQLVH
jgi:DNA-binding winged helix-turn-helix (wHTH) protein